MSLYFPVFVDISQKNVVFIGGGSDAASRVQTILDFAGSVTVVDQEPDPVIVGLAQQERITLHKRRFSETDLERADVVIVATGHTGTDIRIAGMCHRNHIPVTAAGDESVCDFFFPGVARRDPLVVGISASGEDDTLAAKATAYFKNLIEKK